MAHRALRLLLILAASFSSALVATPALRRPHPPHCTRTTHVLRHVRPSVLPSISRATHVRCSESSEASESPEEAGLEGWVSSRRILGSAMAFIDMHAASDDVEQAAQLTLTLTSTWPRATRPSEP